MCVCVYVCMCVCVYVCMCVCVWCGVVWCGVGVGDGFCLLFQTLGGAPLNNSAASTSLITGGFVGFFEK